MAFATELQVQMETMQQNKTTYNYSLKKLEICKIGGMPSSIQRF